MNLIVTDRESIERGIRVRSSYVVISIRDPKKPKAKIRKQSGLRDVLYLAFDDAEPAAGFTLPLDVVLMTPQQAVAIWEFVERWRNEVGTIVVHCEQGMSRSPAVAAAIANKMNPSTGNQKDFPSLNRFVHQTMIAASTMTE